MNAPSNPTHCYPAAQGQTLRRGLLTMFSVAAAVGLSACSETKLASHAAKQIGRASDPSPPASAPAGRGTGIYKVGNPYQINGVWYYPKEDPNYDETGIGSWYGEQFHGRATANGEVFDLNEVTAAHPTLPMPSLVRVTNLENGRSIVVRVNDRGPYANGRVIDLSRRSAQLLGYERQGTAKVRVQYLGPAQLADGSPAVAQRRDDGDKPPVVASPRGAVQAEALPPPPGARGRAAEVATPAQAAPSPVQIVAANNASPRAAPGVRTSPAAELARQEVKVEPVRGGQGIFVQLGAFTQHENAHRLAAQISGSGPVNISSRIVNNVEFFRVRIGPFDQVAAADAVLQRMLNLGQTNARIVVE